MRRILSHRPEAPWRLRRNGLALLAALAIATTLAALALAGVFSSNETSPRAQVKPAVSAKTLKALERLRHRANQLPLYYLGLRFDGLPLVGVNDGAPVDLANNMPVDLVYADCTMLELNTLDPACRRGVLVELMQRDAPTDRPAPGEITSRGRCTFSGRVRGATVALFPSNPTSLLVFTKETTVYISSLYISSRMLRDDLAAARALQGLNVRLAPSEPLPSRDVSRQLGRCRTPRKQPSIPKQRYQQDIQLSSNLASVSFSLPDPAYLDNRSEAQFLAGVRTFPLVLRNEATRLSDVRRPAGVADLQAKLVTELRAFADDVDLSLELFRSGAWHDKPTYLSKRKELNARFAHHSNAILAIVASFRKRGYNIAQKTGD